MTDHNSSHKKPGSKKKTKKKRTKKKVLKKKPSLGLAFPKEDIEQQADFALDTLVRAEKIRGDKKLMKAIEKEKTKRLKALDSV